MTSLPNNTAPVLSYQKVGAGPVIVLIHGFPDSGTIWQAVASKLQSHFTLIIPDLPGSGNSPLPHPMHLPEMAHGIQAILKKEGIAKAIIAGHSMGGYTALAFASLYPQQVVGLSLIHATSAADDEDKKATRQKVIDLILKGGKETFVKQMTLNLFSPAFTTANPKVVAQKTTAGAAMSDQGMVNFYQAMIARPDSAHVLKAATFPVQWIIGVEDNIIDFKKLLIECHYSDVNFVSLYTKCGHISMLEQPEQLQADLRLWATYCYATTPETDNEK